MRDGSVREGFEGKVFYVWFDAPIAYIAATQDWAEENGKDWKTGGEQMKVQKTPNTFNLWERTT